MALEDTSLQHRYRGKDTTSPTCSDPLELVLRQARGLGIQPEHVRLDSGYASTQLLGLIGEQGWHFGRRLRKNRSLNGRPLRLFHRGPHWSLNGGIQRVVYRRGNTFYASSDLDLDWPARRGISTIRNPAEAVFKLLKQECGGQGMPPPSIPAYRRHRTLGLLAFTFLDQLQSARKTTPYKLRRSLISGKLLLNPAVPEPFLIAA